MIRIIGYRGIKKRSWLIRIFTRKKHDHVGFLLDDGRVADARIKGGFDIYTEHNQTNAIVDIYALDIIEEQHKLLRNLILEHAGRHDYDLAGVTGYALSKIFDRKSFQSRRRWFCSEAVVILLRLAGVIIFDGYHPHQISPGKLLKDASMIRKITTCLLVNGKLQGG